MEDLLDRVVKAEDRVNKQEAINTRSYQAKLALGPADDTEQSKQLEDRMSKFQERLTEVESIIEQLNDSSTQPAANTTSPKTLAGLEA